jgi:hypothetical protein
VADAPHLVAVPAIVADHLGALVRDMLRDRGQEVGGGEDLEVPVDLGVESGAVDDDVRRGFQGHFFDGEGVARGVLRKVFEVAGGLRRDAIAGVDVEAAVLPGVEDLDAFRREELLLDEQLDDLGAEEFLEWLDRGVWRGVKVEG